MKKKLLKSMVFWMCIDVEFDAYPEYLILMNLQFHAHPHAIRTYVESAKFGYNFIISYRHSHEFSFYVIYKSSSTYDNNISTI